MVRISKSYRPEIAAGKGSADLLVDAKARRLVATDGRVLVALPVALARGARSGVVPAEAVRAARRRDPAEEQAAIRIDPGRKAVDWRALMPPVRRGDRGTATVTVNVGALRRVADAMGVVEVTLTVPARRRGPGPVLVQPIDDGAAEVGVLLHERRPEELQVVVRRGPVEPMRRVVQRRVKSLDAEADALLRAAGDDDLVSEDLR